MKKKVKKALEAYLDAARKWRQALSLLPCSAAEGKKRFPALNWDLEEKLRKEMVIKERKLMSFFPELKDITPCVHLARHWVKMGYSPLYNSPKI